MAVATAKRRNKRFEETIGRSNPRIKRFEKIFKQMIPPIYN
jgi:hypothetical protein